MRTHAVLRQTPSGNWTLYVRTFPVKAKPNGDHSIYTLVDFNKVLDVTVDCDGCTLKPRMIFKLYCKPGEVKRRQIIKRKSLSMVRAGSPMLH